MDRGQKERYGTGVSGRVGKEKDERRKVLLRMLIEMEGNGGSGADARGEETEELIDLTKGDRDDHHDERADCGEPRSQFQWTPRGRGRGYRGRGRGRGRPFARYRGGYRTQRGMLYGAWSMRGRGRGYKTSMASLGELSRDEMVPSGGQNTWGDDRSESDRDRGRHFDLTGTKRDMRTGDDCQMDWLVNTVMRIEQYVGFSWKGPAPLHDYIEIGETVKGGVKRFIRRLEEAENEEIERGDWTDMGKSRFYRRNGLELHCSFFKLLVEMESTRLARELREQVCRHEEDFRRMIRDSRNLLFTGDIVYDTRGAIFVRGMSVEETRDLWNVKRDRQD